MDQYYDVTILNELTELTQAIDFLEVERLENLLLNPIFATLPDSVNFNSSIFKVVPLTRIMH